MSKARNFERLGLSQQQKEKIKIKTNASTITGTVQEKCSKTHIQVLQ